MEQFRKVWEFLDGKKTAIAWILGILPSAPFIPAGWHESLIWASIIIGGGGVVHKIQKGELQKKTGR